MSNTLKHRILLVDDEPMIVELLAEGVSRVVDCIVDTAVNTKKALNQIAENDYLLVITDYKMPRMTGLELAQIIRTLSPRTRIVMMTAVQTENIRETAEKAGVKEFLEKPVDLTEIRQLVQQIIDEADKQ